jgi:sarcosine oxidase
MRPFDVIVIGLGGMGSATLVALAARGIRVLGLEQFPFAHDRGSSHGQTRIIRTAYYEHPSYVPLVRRSFELWQRLESETGRSLLTASPCLNVGPPGGELLTGVQAAAVEHGLAVTSLTATEIERQFPPFRVGDEYAGLLEQDAGILAVEDCVRAHLDVAVNHGATVLAESPVREWSANDTGVTIHTATDTYHAGKLIVTAGAWATHSLADMGVPLTVMRQTMHWFRPADPAPFAVGRFPVFLLDTPGGAYYGLPAVDARGVKVARHYGAPELPGPEDVNWNVNDTDVSPVRSFLRQHLPTADGPNTGQVCQYTLTPDRHFVIDWHPRYPNVAVAAGFSGHGFKFAPVVGEILADLVETGRTIWDISLFRATRFSTVR